MQYDAVLLDNDGVVIEPPDHDAILAAIRETFEEFGVPDPPADHVEALLGVTSDDLRRICANHGIDPAAFWRQRDANAARVQRREFHEGLRRPYDDLAAMEDLEALLGIVSNNQQETIEYIVDYFDLDVATYYGREPTVAGVHRKKPNPHYLQQAIAELDAETPLYVGDSNADLGAAAAAGVDSVFVRRSHRQEYSLEHDPTYEVDGLHELVTMLNGRR